MAVPTNIRVRVRERAHPKKRGEDGGRRTHGGKKNGREVCLTRRAYVHENCDHDRSSVTSPPRSVAARVCMRTRV